MTSEFFIDGKARDAQPYVYKISGLDDVILLNGFVREETDYGPGISIDNIDNLHEAIALRIISMKKTLSSRDFRFLRVEMNMTQSELGKLLGIDGQTVARYEKGESRISGPVDRLLRFLFVFRLLPEEARAELIAKIQDTIERDEMRDYTPRFREENGSWFETCA
ncbi:hypothetical protein BYZ73_06505 [Rhodovulum viride]|uniref:HTH cro/C1-type domain-containing protein n=1 Tax=Rhodovulum viride TaxID=1231134 RepID=A0ABX9DK11_9RHOB|nr:helix-turn-helix domain-containing protein [Rhodovulum viride]RAP42004.1 hypothetical protein BYZ73_06505 [Rhodovulum viride]